MDRITIPTEVTTLEVKTSLSPAGMRAHARLLLDTALTLDSLAHAATLKSSAQAWEDAAKRLEREEASRGE